MAIMDVIKEEDEEPVLEEALVTALDESKFDPTQLQAINVLTKGANKDGLSLSDILGKLATAEKELAQAKTIKATIASTPSGHKQLKAKSMNSLTRLSCNKLARYSASRSRQ